MKKSPYKWIGPEGISPRFGNVQKGKILHLYPDHVQDVEGILVKPVKESQIALPEIPQEQELKPIKKAAKRTTTNKGD